MTRADALRSAARTEVECWQESTLNIQREVLADFSRFAVALTTSSATVALHQTSNSVNEQHQRGPEIAISELVAAPTQKPLVQSSAWQSISGQLIIEAPIQRDFHSLRI
jgi:hypothetical protein